MKRLIVPMLWALAAIAAQAETDRAVLLALSASVLKIEALSTQGGFALGSGVVVAPERVVTNCHVTRDALKINVLRGGVRWLAEAQATDIDRDLCLLNVPGLRASVVTIGRADRLALGQTVSALGYTGGVGIQHSEGEVIALHRFDGGRVIQSSTWFSSGASGGGLFDADLRLVGILTFRLRGGEVHSFAAPAEWLQGMLDAAPAPADAQAQRDPSRKLAYWQRPAEDRPWFLRAAVLERDDRWADLASLASDWTIADAADPEPWGLMGLALARMNRPAEARRAMGCARAIDPEFAAAHERALPATDRAAAHEGTPPNPPCAPAKPATPQP